MCVCVCVCASLQAKIGKIQYPSNDNTHDVRMNRFEWREVTLEATEEELDNVVTANGTLCDPKAHKV